MARYGRRTPPRTIFVRETPPSPVAASAAATAPAVGAATGLGSPAQHVFTTQTPAENGLGGTYFTLATRVLVGVQGAVTGIRFYMPDTAPTQVVAGLFSRTSDDAGTLLATKAFSTLTPGWQAALFDTPVDVAEDADLYAAVWTDRYTRTTSFFTADVVNGDLTAPADDSVTPARNSRYFSGGTGLTYPTGGTPSCFFVDLLFVAEAAADVTGESAAAAGAVTGSATGTVTALGTSAPVTSGVIGSATGTVTAGGSSSGTVGGVSGVGAGSVSAQGLSGSLTATVTGEASATVSASPVQRVFTTQTPATTDATDGIYYTLATRVRTGVPGAVTGVRYWMPDTAPTQVVAGLFSRTSDASGTLLATKAFSTLTPGWQTATFDAPVAVAEDADLYAAVWTNRYVYTGSFFTADVVNGDLTAPADDSVTPARNSRFRLNGSGPEYPNSGGGSCYFVDLLFLADVTGASASSVGAVTGAATGTVTEGEANPASSDAATGLASTTGTGLVSSPGSGTGLTAPAAGASTGVISTLGSSAGSTAVTSSESTGTVTPPSGAVSSASTPPTVGAAMGTVTVGAASTGLTGPAGSASTGTVTPPRVEGASAAVTSPTTGTGQGTVTSQGSGAGVVPVLDGAATGTVVVEGSSTAVTGSVTVSAEGFVDVPVYLAVAASTVPVVTGSSEGVFERWPGLGPPAVLPDLRAAMIEFVSEHPYSPVGLTVAGAMADDLPAGLLPYAAVFEPPGPPPVLWHVIAKAALNFQVWAATEKEARDVAETLRALTHDAPGRTIDGVLIMSAVDVSGVGHVHDPGHPDLHRAVFTVAVTGRSAT